MMNSRVRRATRDELHATNSSDISQPHKKKRMTLINWKESNPDISKGDAVATTSPSP